MRTTVRRDIHGDVRKLVDRALIGAALLLVMLLVGVQLARSAEPGPAESITRALSTDDAGG